MAKHVQLLRAAALLGTLLMPAPAATRVLRPAAAAAARSWAAGPQRPDQALVAAVVLLAAAGLVAGWLRLVVCTTVCAVDVVAGRRLRTGARAWRPTWARLIVTVAVGGVCAAAPATAQPHRLPSPAWPLERPRARVVVAGGDCLWSIARRVLPRHATPGEVDRAWHRIYAANRAAVGADPDLIRPGTLLRLPAHLPRPDHEGASR
jgi:nucleoid-associated protein YgaU